MPHDFSHPNVAVYSSALDGNTSNGWFYGSDIDDDRRNEIMNYLGVENWDDFHWKLIRLAASSVACLTLFPVQDLLGAGIEGRLCIPEKAKGNWTWKLESGKLTPTLMLKLRKICDLYGRS
jgi:4-alpha-glucanotransferase